MTMIHEGNRKGNWNRMPDLAVCRSFLSASVAPSPGKQSPEDMIYPEPTSWVERDLA